MFALQFALVYRDLNYIQVIFNHFLKLLFEKLLSNN